MATGHRAYNSVRGWHKWREKPKGYTKQMYGGTSLFDDEMQHRELNSRWLNRLVYLSDLLAKGEFDRFDRYISGGRR